MTSVAGASAAAREEGGLALCIAPGRWVLLATVLGSAITAIDATVVGIALPSIGTGFGGCLAAITSRNAPVKPASRERPCFNCAVDASALAGSTEGR